MKFVSCQEAIRFLKMDIHIFQFATWPHLYHMIKEKCDFNGESLS